MGLSCQLQQRRKKQKCRDQQQAKQANKKVMQFHCVFQPPFKVLCRALFDLVKSTFFPLLPRTTSLKAQNTPLRSERHYLNYNAFQSILVTFFSIACLCALYFHRFALGTIVTYYFLFYYFHRNLVSPKFKGKS